MSTSRNAWIYGAALLGLLLCGGCATPQSKPRLSIDARAEALSCFSLSLLAENAGDVEAALRYLKQAIRIDPSEAVLYPSAVAASLQLDQGDEALQLARQFRVQHPDSLDSRLLEAQVCALTGRTEDAEALLRQTALDFPQEAESATALARFLVAQNKTPEAVRTLEAAKTTHSDHAEILHLLGTLYVNRARNMESQTEMKRAVLEGIALLEESLELDPNRPQQWQQVGYAWLAVKDPQKAQTAFEKAHELFPANFQLSRQLLDVYILNGAIEPALALCENLSRFTGTDPELWIQYLMEQLPEQHRDALAGYLEVYLKEHPQAPVIYYTQLGSLYLDQKKLSEAEAILQKAQTVYPENDRVRMVLGYLHLKHERYEKACSAFNQVQTNSPETEWVTNPFFTFNFMVAAQKSGRLEEAAGTLAAAYNKNSEILNRYMQAHLSGETPLSTQSAIDLLTLFRTLSPDATETLYYLTLLQADQENYEEALENARRFKKQAAGGASTNLLNEFFYYQYAVLHERTGQLDEAERFFRKAIDMGNPATVASAQNYIAYMWAERGEKLDMGLKLIQKALEAEPDNAAYIDTLGWIYYMQGRYQEALDQLQRASDLMSDDPVVWEHLGDTYLKLGDRKRAVKKWKKGLEIDPEQQRLIDRLEANGFNPDDCPSPEDSPSDTQSHP